MSTKPEQGIDDGTWNQALKLAASTWNDWLKQLVTEKIWMKKIDVNNSAGNSIAKD